MKTILGSLLCFVLFASECFALSGGPQYGGGVNVVGAYAGVLQPAFDPTDPFSSNSLGVFTLVVPTRRRIDWEFHDVFAGPRLQRNNPGRDGPEYRQDQRFAGRYLQLHLTYVRLTIRASDNRNG